MLRNSNIALRFRVIHVVVVSFCSIRSDHLMAKLKCPAPDGAAWGVAPFRGRTVRVASGDLVGISDLSFAQVPRSTSGDVGLRTPDSPIDALRGQKVK